MQLPPPAKSALRAGYTLARLCVAVCALLWLAEDVATGVTNGCTATSGGVGGVTPGTYGGGSGSTGGTSPTGTLVPPTPPPPPNPNAPIPPVVPPEPGESCGAALGGGSGGGSGPPASCTPVLSYNGQCSLSMWPNGCQWWSSLNPSVNNNPAYVYQGDQCSYGIHYGRCSYPPESCSGGGTIDIDRGCIADNLNANHILVTGYVYIGNFQQGAAACPALRKLIYIQSNNWGGADAWGPVLGTSCDAGQTTMGLYYAAQGPGNPTGATVWNVATLNFNQWYEVGLEVEADTPGQNDGYVNVFVNGQQVYHACGPAAAGNGTSTETIGDVVIGEQLDVVNAAATYDEYRYWDNVVVSTCTP
jgi:hypothetical protein